MKPSAVAFSSPRRGDGATLISHALPTLGCIIFTCGLFFARHWKVVVRGDAVLWIGLSGGGGQDLRDGGCSLSSVSVDHGWAALCFFFCLLACALLYNAPIFQVALVALAESLRVRERILHPFNKELLRTLRLVS